MAAAVIYTIGDLHRPGCIIDYPRGGCGTVIAAMVREQAAGVRWHKNLYLSYLNFGLFVSGREDWFCRS